MKHHVERRAAGGDGDGGGASRPSWRRCSRSWTRRTRPVREFKMAALRLAARAAGVEPAHARSDHHGAEHPVHQPRHEPGAPPRAAGRGAVAAASPRGDAGRASSTTRRPSTPTDNPEVTKIQRSTRRCTQQRLEDESGPERQGPPQQPRAGRARGRDRPHQVRWSAGCAAVRPMCASASTTTAKNGQELAGLQVDLRWPQGEVQPDAVARPRRRAGRRASRRAWRRCASTSSRARRFPTHAMSPNRPLLGLGALLLAMALGLGVGFALDANDSAHSRSGAAA